MFEELNNFFLTSFGVFGLVGGIFGFILYLSHRRLPIEKGLTPIYSERCASPLASIPFVRVTLYEDFMVVKFIGKDVFEYKHLRFAERYGSIFRTGVEINTINNEIYGYAVIYSFNATYLINLINQKVADAHHIKPISPL